MFNIPSFFGFRAGGGQLLLNEFPGAAAAYSLRLLDSTYLGSAIQVRESTNNTTLDIGFVSGELDTAALLAHCAGANGFITEWYDQSGNARNATQGTALNQPQIVSSGSLILENGKPAMTFIDLNDHLLFSSNFSTFNNTTIFSVIAPSTYLGSASNARFYDLFDGINHIQYLRDLSSNLLHTKNTLFQGGLDATQYTTQTAPLTQFLSSVFALSSSNDLYFDSALQSKTATINVGSAGTIGVIGQRGDVLAVTQFIGEYQELIIYQTDQSSNRTGIEDNINDFYSIYP